jgi:hypothetical protein
MTMRPKRAAKRRPPARSLWAAVAVLILVVGGLIGFGVGGAGITTIEREVPVPGPTWTSPVPQTPAVCYEAMEAADEMFSAGLLADEAATEAAEALREANTLAEVAEARKLNDKAKRAAKDVSKSRRAYLELAEKCKAA